MSLFSTKNEAPELIGKTIFLRVGHTVLWSVCCEEIAISCYQDNPLRWGIMNTFICECFVFFLVTKSHLVKFGLFPSASRWTIVQAIVLLNNFVFLLYPIEPLCHLLVLDLEVSQCSFVLSQDDFSRRVIESYYRFYRSLMIGVLN